MKKTQLSKAACAMLASAILCGTVAAINPVVTASAATSFIADTDYNGAWNIDESQIKISAKNIGARTSLDFDVYLQSNKYYFIETDSNYDTAVLSSRTITINLSGSTISNRSAFVEKLKKMHLQANYKLNGKNRNANYLPTVTYKGGNNYELVYEIEPAGTSATFELDTIITSSDVKNLTVKSAIMSSQSSYSYTQYTVDSPNEDLIICLRNENGFTNTYKNNITKWAQRLCIYANALSKTTNIQLGTLCLGFDRPMTAYRCAGRSPVDYILSNVDASKFEMNCIKSGMNAITWGIMHEMSHSYSYKFRENYTFTREIYSDDGVDRTDSMEEFVVNARGLTAFQNCDNLRNLPLYYSDNDTINGQPIQKTYNTIMDNINSSDLRKKFTQKLVKLAKTQSKGWYHLEKFFEAKYDNNYLSQENKLCAKALNELLGTRYSVNEEDFLRFTNNFRKLYLLVTDEGDIDNRNIDNFKNFVSSNFGKRFVYDIAVRFQFY